MKYLVKIIIKPPKGVEDDKKVKPALVFEGYTSSSSKKKTSSKQSKKKSK